MDKKQMYAVQYDKDNLGSAIGLDFFETKAELIEKLKELNEKKTITNQSYLEFARVYPKGAAMSGESYETFAKQVEQNRGLQKEVIGDYLVEKKLKNGKIKRKTYRIREDFDWQLGEWAQKGVTDVVILNENHSYSAQHFYERDVLECWGKKEALFA